MKQIKNALVELGKFFYNLALAVLVSVIIQPIALNRANHKLMIYGLFVAIILLSIGFYIITISDRLNNKDE